jgi:hypothetical protein
VNLWHPSGFMQRLREEVPADGDRNRLARAAALHVLLRDPAGVAALAWRTYAMLWDTGTRLRLMCWDVGQNPLSGSFREALANSYRLVARELPDPTPTSRFYLGVGLWGTLAALVAPLLLAVAAVGRRSAAQRAALGLLIVASGLILVTLPVVRYLHPLGWMLAAGCVPALDCGRRAPGNARLAGP